MSKKTTATAVPAPTVTPIARVAISPPKFQTLHFKLEGDSPYMQLRFSQKALKMMKEKHEQGSQAGKGKKREARDFDADYKAAMYISEEGWNGIPASAFRNACIDVCRMVGFKMTHAKMSVFIEADGIDKFDGKPLIKIQGKPEKTEMPVPNQTGVIDIRVRPMWRKWSVNLKVRFDADQFSVADVTNLLARAGMQVGVGEGRPYSKNSNGMGFGLFKVKGAE